MTRTEAEWSTKSALATRQLLSFRPDSQKVSMIRRYTPSGQMAG